MRSPSRKKLVSTAIALAALCMVAPGALLAGCGSTQGTEVSISADELAGMKRLVHEYLNELNRFAVSSNPDREPEVAGAPVIDPSGMSPALAARQKEDVEKLSSKAPVELTQPFFATFTEVRDIREKGDEVVLRIADVNYYRHLSRYFAEGSERFFTFEREGDGWILADARIVPAFYGFPPVIEPSVEPFEKGTDRVLSDVPEEIEEVPQRIRELDRAATAEIADKWALDEEAMAALEAEIGKP